MEKIAATLKGRVKAIVGKEEEFPKILRIKTTVFRIAVI